MERPNERLAFLLIKHLKDELTVEEQLELQEWVNKSEHNQAIFHQFSDPDKLNEALKEHFSLENSIRDKIDAQMKTAALAEEAPAYYIRPRKRRRWMYIAAAAILLFLSITSYFWLASRFDSSSKARPASAPVAVRDVAPGGNKATLTLGNGSTIILDNVRNGTLSAQPGAKIEKTADGKLTYSKAEEKAVVLQYNMLTTPKGGQYFVELVDGSKVWLNSASSLTYPTFFTGKKRIVQLKGEAYFEVTQNKAMPFHVIVNDMTVEVLGTHFNVNAYEDEASIRTTLLEGAVKIRKGNQTATLFPGQQAQLNSQLRVMKNVDIEEAIAWKNGFFQFHDSDIESVMRSLARWYNVDIKYEGKKSSSRLKALIRRDNYASDVLQILETSGYHFRIEGRTIIVLP